MCGAGSNYKARRKSFADKCESSGPFYLKSYGCYAIGNEISGRAYGEAVSTQHIEDAMCQLGKAVLAQEEFMLQSSSKVNRPWGLIVLVAVISSFLLFPATSAATSSVLLISSIPPEQSTVPAGTQTNDVFATNTVTLNYTGGTVTFSTCPNQACTWALDDAAKLTVTRPDGTQAVRSLISYTHDKPAENVTSLFQLGYNSIRVDIIDLMGPVRGSPNLYLIESSSPLLVPKPPVMSLPTNTRFDFHPYVLNSKDPVNTYTGSYLYVYTDVEITGRGPTPLFARSYDSSNTTVGALGPGWTHSYAVRLVRPNATSNDIVVVGPQGRADQFIYNAGSYAAPAGIYAELVKNADDTYKLTNQDRTIWNFDEIGRLLRITDRFGNQSSLYYNSNGQLVSVSDPAGRGTLTLSYNPSSGRLTSVSDWANRTVSYGYDASGRLSSVTDREGKTTNFGYDGTSQRITTITDARNYIVVTNTYDAQERVVTQKDARGLATGQQTVFTYLTNTNGTKTTTVTYPKTSFDATWNLVEEDTYDTQGRIIKRVSRPTAISGDWITQEYTYDTNGNRASFKDGRGNTTNYCYDVDYSGAPIALSRGNMTREINASPTTGAPRPVTLFKYDSRSNLIQVIPPKGVASGTTVTCQTNLSSGLNLLYATEFVYDDTQTKLLSSSRGYTDPELGQQTKITRYEYGDVANPGLLTKVISPRGNTGATPDYAYATSYTYRAIGSEAGMLESVRTPSGAVTTFDYDAVGRLVKMVDPRGNEASAVPVEHTWEYVYDDEDRQRFTIAPAPVPGQAQLVSELRYDAVGNNIATIDANGQVTRYVYDERDSLLEVHQSPNRWTDPAINPTGLIITEYLHDHLGNMIRVTRAKGAAYERVTDYAYDGLGRIRRETQFPSWPTTTTKLVTEYTYDKNGNRLTLKDPLLRTTSFGYDALNRLTTITYNNTTTPNVTYSYDANGNRTKMVDGTGTTNYTYDELERLVSVQSPSLTTVAYRYDLNGNQRKLIYPDSTAVTYTFDQADRLVSLIDWANRATSYEYFINGMPKQVAHFNDTTAHYSYDNASRLTDVWNMHGANTINRYTYTLDAIGNRTRVDEVTNSGEYYATPITPERQGTIDYSYDWMYRLTQEHRNLPYPQSEVISVYTYDPVGNRLQNSTTIIPFNPNVTNYTYDKADRILNATSDLQEPFTVDANGNMTKRGWSGGETFVYDQANRMIRAKRTTFTYNYTYDGDGKRTRVQQGTSQLTTKHTYVYDVNRDLPVLLQDTTKLQKFVWGLGLLYTVNQYDVPGFYHLDGLGSIHAISDYPSPPDQTRIQMYEEYNAFGVEGYSNRPYDQPFKFVGEQTDEWPQTDYLYLRARYYDPVLGRFISRDPFAGNPIQPLSLNRYTYVENNPANAVDPSGLASSKALQDGCGRGLIEGGLALQKQAFDNMSPENRLLATAFQDLPKGIGVSEQVRKTIEGAGISCIEYEGNVWDTSSYGNVIYGYQLKRLGFPLAVALGIADVDQRLTHGEPDPPDDMEQIKAGYRYGN